MNAWNGWLDTRPQGQNGRTAILHSEAARRAKYMDVLSDCEVRTRGSRRPLKGTAQCSASKGSGLRRSKKTKEPKLYAAKTHHTQCGGCKGTDQKVQSVLFHESW